MKHLMVATMIVSLALFTACGNSEKTEAAPAGAETKTECAEGCEKECCAKEGAKEACAEDCQKECCAKKEDAK